MRAYSNCSGRMQRRDAAAAAAAAAVWECGDATSHTPAPHVLSIS